jgi:autotransporter-associated beta strand protein
MTHGTNRARTSSSMELWRKRITFVIATALLFLTAQRQSFAGSATWNPNPFSNNWNTAQNWIPATVPNGPSDVASFGPSTVTGVTISSSVEVSSVNFNPTAPSFIISVQGVGINLFMSGVGVMNGSGVPQSFMADGGQSAIFFQNTATAGNLTSFSGDAPQFVFTESASAGSATFDVSSDGIFQAHMDFLDFTTAADATINASDNAELGVFENATGANAVFTLTAGAFLIFGDNATADNAIATCIGGDAFSGSNIFFSQFASAGDGQFTAVGASTSGEAGSFIEFTDSATAANGTFVINGNTAPDLAAASMTLLNTASGGNATITVNGGSGGGEGGILFFNGQSDGGTASLNISGNSQMDISGHGRRMLTVGSIDGDGAVFLGARALAIGSNNQGAAFSGIIQDGGSSGGTGGSLTKVGTGTFSLSGSNTYTGGTTVSAGVLEVANQAGSATSTGSVNVNAGTLAGRGIIAGAVNIGTGSGAGAFLAPAAGTNVQATVTIQSALTFTADATYTCTFRAKRNRARTDKVIANGVTINSGASIALSGQTQGALRQGLVLTLISNTSANPITGTFNNLPDAGIVTVNGNNFQASYEGGDGNDLTLTVVP